MNKRIIILCAAAISAGAFAGDYPYTAAVLTNVTVTGGFWLPRFETNRIVTLRTDFEKCEMERIPNFRRAAAHEWGTFKGIPFDDSDVYKVIEGAAYTLATHPDAKLEKYVDGVNAAIAGAQELDGYLYTARTLGFTVGGSHGKVGFDRMGPTRWSYLEHSHEFYNVGHLYEAAVAYWEATGKRTLLDVAIKSADLIDRTFGPSPSQLKDTSGHEEIELALCKLYRATGDERYLKLAQFLLEMRGRKHGASSGKVSAQSGELVSIDEMRAPGSYSQNHMPVVRQREAVGHAVRATYLYCGMADVAALSGNKDYINAIDAIWENVVYKKLHLNGSVGARHDGESFGANYELPNESAYLETCAGIGNALWNERMFLMHGDAKYIDVLERVLYNGILSGVSLSGKEFFYPNPMSSKGGYRRSAWFGCSCCPVNVVRLIPQVAPFAYATREDAAYVNLFVESDAKLSLKCGDVKLSQKTAYPWSGQSRIAVEPPSDGARFAVNVRVPGWCVGRPVPSDLYTQVKPGTQADFSVKVNGTAVKAEFAKGYCVISRAWKSGDVVEVSMNMPVRRIKANDKVAADRGLFAVERGPILFCAEGMDNGDSAFEAHIPLDATFAEKKIMACGQEFPSLKSSNGVTLVPYCIWGNREPGNAMQTWFPPKPLPEPPVGASHCFYKDTVDAAFDGKVPSASDDHSIPRLTFWDHRGTKEWVQCGFDAPKEVRGVEVYWFDDTGIGECRLPASWKVQWRPDKNAPWRDIGGEGPVEKDCFCAVDFPAPVKAQAIRISLKLRDGASGGILECRFK